MNHIPIALKWISEVKILTTVSLIIAIMTFCIGFYAYGKAQKSKASVLTLGLCISIGIWVLASAFIFSADPQTSVWFWYYVQTFGFIPMWPILIHFLSVLAGLDSLPGKKVTLFKYSFSLNFASSAVITQYVFAFAIHIWMLMGAGEPTEYVHTSLGLRDTPAVQNLCVQIFTFMNFFWYIECMFLVILFWKKAHKKNISIDMKRQSEVITITGILFGGITIVFNIILPMLNMPIPAVGSLSIGFWIISIAFTVARYNFGSKDEQIIGQKAFDLSAEPMAVTDAECNILFVNSAFAAKYGNFGFEYSKNMAELFDPHQATITVAYLKKERSIPSLEITDSSGKRRFIHLQSSFIYNKKVLERLFFILSDVTDITNQKQILEYLVDERTAEINRQLVITERYTRPSLVQVIQAGGDPTNFEPATKDMVIMFADIRDFTLLSEKLSSADTVKLLNSYFTCMNECIIQQKGEIDKLIGDAIMALFESSDHAVQAAIKMIYKLESYNECQQIINTKIRNGIGINFGRVTRGNIGSKEKLDFTVIGDSVNAASRFEALTKRYHLPVVISEDVVNELKEEYQIRFIDNVLVKGRECPTKLYEVFDFNNADTIELKRRNQLRLTEAFYAYSIGDFISALSLYIPLYEKYGDKDPLLGFYVRRCQELLALQQLDKLKTWNGIYQFTDK
ncbi:MAG TPA: adenylate/guanylate cyclase domain-containing protein [Treponemataceae bacterium]|nr:adenylate/guanylate cyclase domain-containing protein [Treponemataceae bacterium]